VVAGQQWRNLGWLDSNGDMSGCSARVAYMHKYIRGPGAHVTLVRELFAGLLEKQPGPQRRHGCLLDSNGDICGCSAMETSAVAGQQWRHGWLLSNGNISVCWTAMETFVGAQQWRHQWLLDSNGEICVCWTAVET
jgi:hypothetical protein